MVTSKAYQYHLHKIDLVVLTVQMCADRCTNFFNILSLSFVWHIIISCSTDSSISYAAFICFRIYNLNVSQDEIFPTPSFAFNISSPLPLMNLLAAGSYNSIGRSWSVEKCLILTTSLWNTPQ